MIKRNGPWAVPLASFTLAVTIGLFAGPLSPVLGHRAQAAVTCDCIAKLESVHESLIWGGGGPGNQTVTQFSITLEPVTLLATASKQLAGALKVTLNATATLHANYVISGVLNGSPFTVTGDETMDIQVNPKQHSHSTKVKCPTGNEYTDDKFTGTLNSMITNAAAKAKANFPDATNLKVKGMTLSFLGGSVKTNVHAASTCANSDGPGMIPLTNWPAAGNGTNFFDYNNP